ncbi:glyoxalase [Pimelobacter simplex]|uniref:Putative quinone binding protein n=1 Tax=Nocardioides simplex TaxID=2045 RepID=A0A0A1DEJ0_NOCSI|nr:VOC family protein [Pimelobacter simplex]AIY15589.1 putative quinone binding protein [Pimelobacter simplex]MCG8150671.1 glyoxalase [Pimelobacter simplex]SFM85260.1 Glyoxalase/Bleomycin resistance protein/Dioxygenase superfamily protein [Pimelobacter simplex]
MALRLGFIGIVTQDLTASLAFYRDLGVPIPDDVDPASPHVDAQLENGTALAWDTVDTIRGFDPSYVVPTGGHRIALAFDQETPAAVDTTYAAMVAAGHTGHIAPWDAFWGQRYATLLDPDGNSVELFALLAPTS